MRTSRQWLRLVAFTLMTGLSLLPVSFAQDRERDREPPRTNRDRDRGEGRERERDGEEGTEEGMPRAEAVPDGRERLVQPRWRLGVFAVNTATGVRITRVLPESPAWRVGLERGDVIVTVNGYQVGDVKGRTYPLGDELQRRAGPRGEVTLLVHNVRNRELLNLDATLDRSRR